MSERTARAPRPAPQPVETRDVRFPDVSASEVAAAFSDLLQALPELAGPRLDSSDLGNRDPALLRRVAPLFYAIGRYYFRGEGEGLENLPRNEQFIVVGNHSAPPI